MTQELRNALRSLIGQSCWATIAGAGTGSVVSLYFGDKIPRKKRLTNPHLSPEAQGFDGEYVLFIEESAWRIESSEQVLCSSLSSNDNEGPMLSSLHLLQGKRVLDLTLRTPSLDLAVAFEGGLMLSIFNFHEVCEEMDNYSISNRRDCIIVSTGGVVAESRAL